MVAARSAATIVLVVGRSNIRYEFDDEYEDSSPRKPFMSVWATRQRKMA